MEEMIDGFVLGCLGRPLLIDGPQGIVDLHRNACLLPGLTGGGLLTRLVGFPTAFGKDPSFPPRRLYQEDIIEILCQGHDACDESFASVVISCRKKRRERVSWDPLPSLRSLLLAVFPSSLLPPFYRKARANVANESKTNENMHSDESEVGGVCARLTLIAPTDSGRHGPTT